MGELVREHVHRQRRHAHVGLAARHAFLRRLRVQAAVRLAMSGQIAGRGVLLSALAAHEPIALAALFRWLQLGVAAVGHHLEESLL